VSRFGIIPATIFDTDLEPQDIALLALLSTYADKSGYCWPSYETLATKLNRSKAWVSERIHVLEDKQFLKISKRGKQKYGFKVLYDTVQPTEQTVQPSERTVQPAEQNNTKNNTKNNKEENTQIADDFQPTRKMWAYLNDRRPDIDPQLFLDNFITSCQAKGYSYKRWDMAWAKWINSEPKVSKYAKQKGNNLEAIHDAFADAREEIC
jgi:predicted transcriptional regulator